MATDLPSGSTVSYSGNVTTIKAQNIPSGYHITVNAKFTGCEAGYNVVYDESITCSAITKDHAKTLNVYINSGSVGGNANANSATSAIHTVSTTASTVSTATYTSTKTVTSVSTGGDDVETPVETVLVETPIIPDELLTTPLPGPVMSPRQPLDQ